MLLKLALLILTFTIGFFIPYLVERRANYFQSFKLSKFNKKFLPYQVLTGILTASVAYLLFLKLEGNTPLYFSFLLIYLYLIFISIYDIRYLEIPDKSSIFAVLLLLLVNLVLLITQTTIETNFITIEPIKHILAGIIFAVILFLIVVLTKGKGMGAGDIRLAALLGFSFGIERTVIGFYFGIFSGLLISLIIILLSRQFKGIKVPFIPLMVLGFFIATLIVDPIYVFYQFFPLLSLY